MPKLRFEVERDGLSVWLAKLSDLKLRESSEEFEIYEQNIFSEIRAQDDLESMKDDPLFRSYRDLYWTFGMDPTKQRVASEALRRRILRGLNLWRISDLVDVANLASAYHKLPIGLVDDAKRVGELRIRTAQKNELFTRIGGKTIKCRGREIVLADDEKIVCFGYATHDSEQTKVTPESKDVLILIYGAQAVTNRVMNSAVKVTTDMVHRWLDCTLVDHRIYRLE
ncbi:MAG: B3/B4 domain-containing protein [Candidatus Thorarchaeota archaeon]|jgi:DNA/RNA-binding domain of Phe-tRNA-synthetase-like protein